MLLTSLKRAIARRLVTARQWIALNHAGVGWRSIVAACNRAQPDATLEFTLANGLSFAFPAGEPIAQIFYDICVRRLYDHWDLNLKGGSTVFDIGAHAGLFTLKTASENPAARIIAVEPSPRMFDCLQRNISANRFQRVTAAQAACGGHRGRALLYARGLEEANTLYDHDVFGSQFRALAEVEVLTLDDLFRKYDVHSCDLLKLNCEGAEYEILLNAPPETLNKVRRIAAQYHVGMNHYSPEELKDFLQMQGFSVEVLPRTSVESGFLYACR